MCVQLKKSSGPEQWPQSATLCSLTQAITDRKLNACLVGENGTASLEVCQPGGDTPLGSFVAHYVEHQPACRCVYAYTLPEEVIGVLGRDISEADEFAEVTLGQPRGLVLCQCEYREIVCMSEAARDCSEIVASWMAIDGSAAQENVSDAVSSCIKDLLFWGRFCSSAIQSGLPVYWFPKQSVWAEIHVTATCRLKWLAAKRAEVAVQDALSVASSLSDYGDVAVLRPAIGTVKFVALKRD